MTKNKQIFKYAALIGLVVVATAFIFCNSSCDGNKSRNMSDTVTEMLLPRQYVDNGSLSLAIRKLAHLIEYAALGIAALLLTECVRTDYGVSLFAAALFYVLAVAVLDEHIQSFSDRTSSTGDIILDFCGALIGFFIGWVLIKIFAAIKQHCSRRNTWGGTD